MHHLMLLTIIPNWKDASVSEQRELNYAGLQLSGHKRKTGQPRGKGGRDSLDRSPYLLWGRTFMWKMPLRDRTSNCGEFFTKQKGWPFTVIQHTCLRKAGVKLSRHPRLV